MDVKFQHGGYTWYYTIIVNVHVILYMAPQNFCIKFALKLYITCNITNNTKWVLIDGKVYVIYTHIIYPPVTLRCVEVFNFYGVTFGVTLTLYVYT
jgi:hypothetical protein